MSPCRCVFVLTVLNIVVSLGSAAAQQPRWSVTLIATGPTTAAQEVSRQLASDLQNRLRPSDTVAVRGDIRVFPRSALNRSQLVQLAKNVEVGATAIIEFVPRAGRTTGYAHVTVAHVTQDSSDNFAQYLDKADVQIWQLDSLAAFITESVSNREHSRVELFVYVVPRGSFFTVGGSDPSRADERGRADDEGFHLWIGTRPAGITTLEIYNLPDYETARPQIQIPRSDGRPYRTTVATTLSRKP